MIHYRDMTFCAGNGCTKFDTCPRALTEKVKADAAKWWGGDDAPICRFSKPEKLECYRAEGDGEKQP